jgi:hypothetical protein
MWYLVVLLSGSCLVLLAERSILLLELLYIISSVGLRMIAGRRMLFPHVHHKNVSCAVP